MAILIFFTIGLGAFMTEVAKGNPLRGQLFSLHKSIGVTILLLAIIRIVWLFISAPPKHSHALQPMEIFIAKGVIGLMYIFMLLIPIIGYLMVNAKGYPVVYFEAISLPNIIAQNHDTGEFFESVHAILAYSILVLVFLHVAGALKHRFFSKDPEADVLKRML